MERGGCSLISSLEEKRNKKLLQLTSCPLTPPSSSLPTSHAPAHSSSVMRTHKFPHNLQVVKSSARKPTPYRKPKDRPKTSAGTRLSSLRRGLNRPPAREIGSELKEIKETLRSLVSQVYSYVQSGVCSQNASLLIDHGNSVVSVGVSGGLLIDDEIGGIRIGI